MAFPRIDDPVREFLRPSWRLEPAISRVLRTKNFCTYGADSSLVLEDAYAPRDFRFGGVSMH